MVSCWRAPATAPVRAVYLSAVEPSLIIIDKEIARAKADAADVDRVHALFERCERERFSVISPDAVDEVQEYGILKELNQVLRKCERIRL